jgi:N4-gp56 family major capsid protein
VNQKVVEGVDILTGKMSDFPHLRFADYSGATREQDMQNAIQPKYYSSKVVDALYERSILVKIADDISGEASHPAQGLYAYKEVALSGSGLTDDTSSLQGQEERLSLQEVSFTVAQLDHAVAFTRNALLLPVVELRQRAQNLLSNWFNEKMETQLLSAVETDAAKVFYGGTATAPNNITANDTSAPGDMKKAYFYMLHHKIPGFTMQELKDWFGSQAAGLQKASNPRGGWYVAVLHPGQIFDITETTEWKDAAAAAATAEIQVAMGPQFQATIYAWFGVLMVPCSLCTYNTPGGYSVGYARGFVFGKQAIAFGFQKLKRGQVQSSGMDWKEARFDYDRLEGVAVLTRTAKGTLDKNRYVGHFSALSTDAQSIIS